MCPQGEGAEDAREAGRDRQGRGGVQAGDEEGHQEGGRPQDIQYDPKTFLTFSYQSYLIKFSDTRDQQKKKYSSLGLRVAQFMKRDLMVAKADALGLAPYN